MALGFVFCKSLTFTRHGGDTATPSPATSRTFYPARCLLMDQPVSTNPPTRSIRRPITRRIRSIKRTIVVRASHTVGYFWFETEPTRPGIWNALKMELGRNRICLVNGNKETNKAICVACGVTDRETKMEGESRKKLKILCLHGFRTSGRFLKKQISKWDPSLFTQFDMDFPDGKYPAGGKSAIEGIFPPPYFEWFQFDKDFTVYFNLEESISYLCEYITANGPFDGFIGFSQGATLSALLIGYQAQGKLLTENPPIKLFISISGSKFRDPSIFDVAFKDPIKAKSVHFIGEKDWLKMASEELASAFDKPLIIRHPQGHTVPRLDEEATSQLRNWIAQVLCQPKVGVLVCEHEIDHEENKSEEEQARSP